MANKESDYQLQLIQHIYNQIPSFTDIFTEDTFYMFFTTFVVTTILIVFIISRFVTIKPIEY